jgi:hypothetical protein
MQLLDSVNRTFGYKANDPQRIVRLEAPLKFAKFDRKAVASGDLSKPLVEQRVAIITEQGGYLRKGDRILPMPTIREREIIE